MNFKIYFLNDFPTFDEKFQNNLQLYSDYNGNIAFGIAEHM